jgi:hypothetical protein
VYDQSVSLIHWKHPETHQEYTAALGYDINLLGQVGKFVRQGKEYQLFLMCTPQSTGGQLAALRAQRGLPPIVAPEVATDEYHLISGDSADAVGMEPLLAIHEIYLAEKNRLIQYQHDIKEYRAQEKAWKDAHPEPTSPTVFWFKPRRNSRYLTEQDKLDQAAAATERAEAAKQEGGDQ